MWRWLEISGLLFAREASRLLPWFVVVLGVVSAVEVTLRLTPWSSQPEASALLFELLVLIVAVGLAGLISARQAADLTKGRTRHFLSFPITPAQAVTTKTAAGALMSAVVLLTVTSLWFASGGSGADPANLDFVLWVTVDASLLSMLMWALVSLAFQVGQWIVHVVVIVSLVTGNALPRTHHPLYLLLDFDAVEPPQVWARLAVAAAVVALVVINERVLALRPVQ